MTYNSGTEPDIREMREAIEAAKVRYGQFIESCRVGDTYRLTPNSETSAYALCFAIFGLNLIGHGKLIEENKIVWDKLIRKNLTLKRDERKQVAWLNRDKPYLQLLAFSLSALSILGTLKQDPLRDKVMELIPTDIESELRQSGVLSGTARSGNHAMFLAIFLIHARDYLGEDTEGALSRWLKLHLKNMNRFGFWGNSSSMSHLQFQNGYHQYEIMDYLEIDDAPWYLVADNVSQLADKEGQFAPYPGGGGCYDYDAVFLITAAGASSIKRHKEILNCISRTILSAQGEDGGFCESLHIRPRSPQNIRRAVEHILMSAGRARLERLRQCLTLLRPKHDRISTHWSEYSRRWDESDLWDSWFRMLTIAKIQMAVAPDGKDNWGFISYPGIGFHNAHTRLS